MLGRLHRSKWPWGNDMKSLGLPMVVVMETRAKLTSWKGASKLCSSFSSPRLQKIRKLPLMAAFRRQLMTNHIRISKIERTRNDGRRAGGTSSLSQRLQKEAVVILLGSYSHHVVVHSGAAHGRDLEGLQGTRCGYDGVGGCDGGDDVLDDPLRQRVGDARDVELLRTLQSLRGTYGRLNRRHAGITNEKASMELRGIQSQRLFGDRDLGP